MKVDFSKSGRNFIFLLKKHSPEILTGVGIVGMVSTTILAVKATPKALELLEKKKNETGEDLKTVEVVKVGIKPYIPAIVTGTLSVGCLIGGATVNARRNAALLTAYTIAENSIKEYKDKVVETIGEKKEKAIRDSIDHDRMEKNPVKSNEVIITGGGGSLCYDTITGKYFESDIEKLRKIENSLNFRLIHEMYISLNDYYEEVGLPACDIGNDMGWNVDNGLIELNFSSQIASNGKPCLVVSFMVEPRYDFRCLY